MLKVRESNSKLLLTNEVVDKIKAWCNANPNREWSGYMYYTAEGNFPDDVLITAKDIFVMDVGSGTYTEYDPDSEEFLYRTENDLLDCYVAGIHSHNTMNAFHSGTDLSTVEEWGSQMPHFLSLVVNNKMETDCMISRQIMAKIKTTFKTFGGKEAESEETEDTCIEGLKLKVEFEKDSYTQYVEERMKTILEDKRRRGEEKVKVYILGNRHPKGADLDIDKGYPLADSFHYDPDEDVLPMDWEEVKSESELSDEEMFNLTQLLVTGVIWSDIKDYNHLESFIDEKMPDVMKRRFKSLDDYIDFVEFFADYIDLKVSPFLDNKNTLLVIASNIEKYVLNNEYIEALYNFIIEKSNEFIDS